MIKYQDTEVGGSIRETGPEAMFASVVKFGELQIAEIDIFDAAVVAEIVILSPELYVVCGAVAINTGTAW